MSGYINSNIKSGVYKIKKINKSKLDKKFQRKQI